MTYFFKTFSKARWRANLLVLAAILSPMPNMKANNDYTRSPAYRSGLMLERAQYEFKQKNYDKAIELYRGFLRKNKGNAQVWNELAASYYHTGLPKRALRFFKKVQNFPVNRSYNFYYQGLCYLAIENLERANQYFYYSAQTFDEYGSRASFELASLAYNARDRKKAIYWLNTYLSRYANGVYANIAGQMRRSIDEGRFIEGITGTQKPDMENALFRYNPLSLHPSPHFWFTQIGYDFVNGSQQNPKQSGEVVEEPFASQSIDANAGIGIGPLKVEKATTFAGYTYRQRWVTENDRVETYLSDPLNPSNLKYQPYRPDLLERRHQIYGDVRRKLGEGFYLGVFGRMELNKVGCNLCPLPDKTEISRVLDTSTTTLLIPWAGFTYLENFQTLVYLYFRKEINKEAPEISNKTFSLFDNDNAIISYGVSQTFEFPEAKTTANAELFQYEFIFNDRYLDYSRLGFLVSFESEFMPSVFVTALAGVYQDDYELRRPQQGSCEYKPQGNDRTSINPLPIQCVRTDSGFLVQGGVYWNYTQFHRIAGYVTQVENANPKQKVFDKTETKFLVVLTMAFPSVKRVLRYVDRFADVAFTKEAE